MSAFLMGPFLFLIKWTLVKSVFTKSLWNRQCISYETLPITHKLILVKCVFMKTLWDRVCISYGTLVVVVYPLPWPLLVGGVRCSRLWSTSQLFRPSGQQCCLSTGSVHKSRGDNVVRMWVQLKRWCVSCVWMLQRGHSGDGCVLASTLC